MDQWKSLAREHGVDLILTAHRHIQEVHVHDEANLVAPTAWVVSGGGGGITSEGEPSEDGQDDQRPEFIRRPIGHQTLKAIPFSTIRYIYNRIIYYL